MGESFDSILALHHTAKKYNNVLKHKRNNIIV